MSDPIISRAPANDALNSAVAIDVAATTKTIFERLQKEFLAQVARGGVKLTATETRITRLEQITSESSNLEGQLYAKQQAQQKLGEKPATKMPAPQGLASTPTAAEVQKAKDQIVESKHLAEKQLKTQPDVFTRPGPHKP